MNEKANKIIHSRIFIIILVLVLVGATLLVGTYAWFTWSSTDNTSLTMTIGKLADVVFASGNKIDAELAPVFNYTDGLSTTFSINNRDTSGASIKYKVKLNIDTIDSELISDDVKFVLEKDGVVVVEQGMATAGASDGVSIDVYSDSLATGTTSFVFYLYIDGNVENDPDMMGKTITGNIMVEAEESTGINLIEHITTLYVDNYDSTYNTAFADGEGMNYYAPSVRLMNDGLDSTGAMVSETNAVNGTSGNIRYYGADDDNLKNYIYFNCSDYSSQSDSTCEKWRIVGIVDGKVKIMRNEVLGTYSWDYTSSGEYDNNWNAATLMSLLNETYYNSGTTTYYNGTTGGIEVSFASNGITEATRTKNLISSSSWYINGMSSSDIYANISYTNERTGTSTWPGNIALLYPSDYGYAVDINNCEYTICNYRNCIDYNWMYNIVTNYENNYAWLLTPDSSSADSALDVFDSGSVGFGSVNDIDGFSPVLYLNSELTIASEGDGSSGNPYRLSVN